jgi:hypothetical protein
MLTRNARFGLLSPVEIFWRRFDARGAIEINIGLPESSVRGFWIGCAGFAVEASDDVARVRRGMCCRFGNMEICAGARKSRKGDCEVAPEDTLLYARVDWIAAVVEWADPFAIVLLAIRRQDAHMVEVDAIVAISRLW